VDQSTSAAAPAHDHRLSGTIVPRLVKAGYQGLLPVAPPDATMSPDSKVAPGKVPSDKGRRGWRGVPRWSEESYSPQLLHQQVTVHGAGIGINSRTIAAHLAFDHRVDVLRDLRKAGWIVLEVWVAEPGNRGHARRGYSAAQASCTAAGR
jgi:hypothetical protein